MGKAKDAKQAAKRAAKAQQAYPVMEDANSPAAGAAVSPCEAMLEPMGSCLEAQVWLF